MRRNRRTKLIATLGPASESDAIVRALFEAGADVFRINMSHSSHAVLNARVLQMFGNLAATSGERNETNSLSAYPYVASDVLLVVLYEMPEPSVQPG